MSFVEETKLLPEDRDSQIVWAKPPHVPLGMIPASERLMPNSANCPAFNATGLIGFFATVIGLSLTPPSATRKR